MGETLIGMEPVTITLNDKGKVASVDFVQWIMNEIGDKAFKRQQVADTYAVLLRKGVTPEDVRKINRAIIERWSRAGLTWIKEQAWKRSQSEWEKL